MSSAKEEVAMTSTETIAEVAEVAEVAETVTSNDTVIAEMTAKIEELTVANNQLQADVAAATAEMESVKEEAAKHTKEELDKKEEELKNVKAELEAAMEVLAGYKQKEEEMLKQEKKLKRKASLLEQGIDADTAANVVEKFESMEDEAFDAMTSFFVSIASKNNTTEPAVVEPVTESVQDTTTASASNNADPAVLDSVEVEEEISLSVGGEAESTIDSTRAALVEFVYSKLGKKNSK